MASIIFLRWIWAANGWADGKRRPFLFFHMHLKQAGGAHALGHLPRLAVELGGALRALVLPASRFFKRRVGLHRLSGTARATAAM